MGLHLAELFSVPTANTLPSPFSRIKWAGKVVRLPSDRGWGEHNRLEVIGVGGGKERSPCQAERKRPPCPIDPASTAALLLRLRPGNLAKPGSRGPP